MRSISLLLAITEDYTLNYSSGVSGSVWACSKLENFFCKGYLYIILICEHENTL